MRNSDWSSDVCSADLPSAVSARKCGWTEPCETKHWRKRWDSNPRTGCPVAGFQDRFLKPLGHSSMPFRGWQLTTGLWVKTPGESDLRYPLVTTLLFPGTGRKPRRSEERRVGKE